MCLGLKRKGSDRFVYNLMSDGELNEGPTREAAMSAGLEPSRTTTPSRRALFTFFRHALEYDSRHSDSASSVVSTQRSP